MRDGGAEMANGAEESGCAGGENGVWLRWGWGRRGRLISGAASGAARVGWLVGFGDATHVGVGDLLGVDPR